MTNCWQVEIIVKAIVEVPVIYSNLKYFVSENNYSYINIFSENVQNDNDIKTQPKDQINKSKKIFLIFISFFQGNLYNFLIIYKILMSRLRSRY